MLHVGPQFNADAAQDQQPEHDHQRPIEAAETGSVEQRERKVESAYAASANRREPTESMTYRAGKRVRAKLEFHRDPGQHAHDEVKAEDSRPETCRLM
jgi:hypothetical protein